MSVMDSRPDLQFEVVLSHVIGAGVTVLAKVAWEDDAKAIVKLFEKQFGKGNVSFREVAA